MNTGGRIHRLARPVQLVSLALIIIAFVAAVRVLPVDQAVRALESVVERAGFWGPLIFGLSYAVAAVLFIPASALTLAAGAIFGLGVGTATVSFGSTLAVGLSFLIARYLARGKVMRMTTGNPNFHAIDKAIGEEGWKIVVLLRLSPAIPFNLQNYLYGLTAIGFWPCVLASWLAMLPGTFMYVYFGYLARAGAQAVSSGREAGEAGRWIITVLGLAATVAVTVYATRLARRAIRQRTAGTVPDSSAEPPAGPSSSQPQKWSWATTLTLISGLLFAAGAVWANLNADKIQNLLGPPAVTLQEVYQEEAGAHRFDHSLYGKLLQKHVDEQGWVNYAGLLEDEHKLDRYIAAVAEAPFDQMGRSERLALLINAYNAFTLRLILDYWHNGTLTSIKEIASSKRWDDAKWNIGGQVWSLNQIEHEQIRPKFIEPRIHFALVCAAVGCPKLRNEAYEASRIEDQLEDQARYVHRYDRWFRFDSQENVVYLTQLYQWYGNDFEQAAGSVLEYASRYSAALQHALLSGDIPEIRWLEYDWMLNSRQR